MNAFAVQLLSASELEIRKTFFKSFAHLYIFELFLNEIASILDQVEGNLQISCLNQLV